MFSNELTYTFVSFNIIKLIVHLMAYNCYKTKLTYVVCLRTSWAVRLWRHRSGQSQQQSELDTADWSM